MLLLNRQISTPYSSNGLSIMRDGVDTDYLDAILK